MLAVFPFHNGDVELACGLFSWISDLGNCPNHDALLVVDESTQWSSTVEAIGLAEKAFRSVTTIFVPAVEGWIPGSVAMFTAAAKWCEENGQPWLWVEADCAPLEPGWLSKIEEVYKLLGRPFMGPLIKATDPRHPPIFMEGIAVHPPDAYSRMKDCLTPNESWVTSCASAVIPHAVNTPLIHQFFGGEGMPPRFVPFRTANSQGQDWTLDNLRQGAVIFHREKTGELIALLRQRRLPPCPSSLVVVIPFCNNDANLAIHHLRWLHTLHGSHTHDCVLLVTQDISAQHRDDAIRQARAAFQTVDLITYAGTSGMGWPEGPNTAFRAACGTLQARGRPWLWLEPDAVVLRADWLRVLENEYEKNQKPFFGPIVPGMGHMNGVGIYPSNAIERLRHTIRNASGLAWDSEMRNEMIHDCFDAGEYIQHCWGIADDAPHPFTGSDPCFPTSEHVRAWVLPSAVVFHRCKNGSLIARLLEIKGGQLL